MGQYNSVQLRGAFTIRSCHGKYLCAHPTGQVTGADVPRDWERYEVDTVNGSANTIKIKGAHGQYLCVENETRVMANRPQAAQWESFDVTVLDQSPNSFRVQLRSKNTGKFLSAQPGGNLEANREKADAWETFTFTRV